MPATLAAERPDARPVAAAAALAGYGRVSLEARVAGASPHQLVAMLYQRLAQLLREAEAALRLGDVGRRLRATEKALAIVDGLDGTLDEERGGSVATALRQVYELLRARLLAGSEAGLAEARVAVEEIGGAWAGIGAGIGAGAIR
ncbi:flagellar export chaperone FliS [Sandaracinobacteroides hominis]|uniref:flagellar export chaperone FliS n=1 Tax=Sandaracinobacteroides hominis TaxID=2780086 RepID=UPI0018F66A56|nr:flagellar export chaperone FliS [Sandaracinobacteroides hominis]